MSNNNCTPCTLAANPVPNSGWLWVGAAVVLGAVAWLATREKKSSSWTCRAGMECTHFVKGDDWHANNLIDKSLTVYKAPPDNLKDLTLEVTAPDGSYHTYVVEKPATLPDFIP